MLYSVQHKLQYLWWTSSGILIHLMNLPQSEKMECCCSGCWMRQATTIALVYMKLMYPEIWYSFIMWYVTSCDDLLISVVGNVTTYSCIYLTSKARWIEPFKVACLKGMNGYFSAINFGCKTRYVYYVQLTSFSWFYLEWLFIKCEIDGQWYVSILSFI